MNTLRYAITVILGLALPYAVQRADLRGLTPAQREHAWNAASWGAALYAFGPLSMVAWCLVTRWPDVLRWWRDSPALGILKVVGLLACGLAMTACLVLAIEAVDELVAALTGAPE